MNKIYLVTLSLFFSSFSIAQIKAVTETGREVLLLEDGTWKYADDSSDNKTEIPVNSKSFQKSSNATFQIKSSKTNFAVWVDPKKWQFGKGENNKDAEYELHYKGKDLYGMMITEKIQIPIESFLDIALDNAKKAAPDTKVVKEEYRTVNNKKILLLQLNGTLNGIKFSYYGYYASNESGTVQFVTYTAQNLLPGYLNDAEELLNGIVETVDPQ